MSRFIAVKEAKLWTYPLAMTNIAMVEPWPIEIDGLPKLKMVDLSMAMLVMNRG